MSDRIPDWARAGRGHWKHIGTGRPSFALEPKPGQESVWDYPRPPVLVADTRHVVVRCQGVIIADTHSACRILETASPPTFYVPRADVDTAPLEPASGRSRCEWKGEAQYWTVVVGDSRLERVGWSYPDPFPPFEAVAGHIAFYPAQLECTVDGERVRPQPGGFYGGWVTDEIVGPMKGEAGTGGW